MNIEPQSSRHPILNAQRCARIPASPGRIEGLKRQAPMRLSPMRRIAVV